MRIPIARCRTNGRVRGGRSSVALPAFAEGLEEDFEVILVDLEDARVEGAVPCARVTALLGVEEGKAKFAVGLVKNGPMETGGDDLLLADVIKVSCSGDTDDDVRVCLLIETG